MTLATKSDLENAARAAQWSSCYSFRNHLNGGEQPNQLLSAAYHAGEAWAYYQASDIIARLEAKIADLTAKKEKAK